MQIIHLLPFALLTAFSNAAALPTIHIGGVAVEPLALSEDVLIEEATVRGNTPVSFGISSLAVDEEVAPTEAEILLELEALKEKDLLEEAVQDVIETGTDAPDAAVVERRETEVAATDRLLFSVSISSFLTAKAATDPPALIWADNGCSSSPDKPLSFNFLPSCQRHDFGYRNYKAQSRFTYASRLKIDQNFRTDLRNKCAQYALILRPTCRDLADTYYTAVRLFGWL